MCSSRTTSSTSRKACSDLNAVLLDATGALRGPFLFWRVQGWVGWPRWGERSGGEGGAPRGATWQAEKEEGRRFGSPFFLQSSAVRGGSVLLLPNRRKEPIGRVLVRPQAQVAGGRDQVGRVLDARRGQRLGGVEQHEVGVGRRERVGDAFVFIGDQAAGGVHQPAARLEQAGSAVQDGRLLDLELLQRLR